MNFSKVTVRPAILAESPKTQSMLVPYLSEIGADSQYQYLDLYWKEPTRYPYLIVNDNSPIGFVLVRQLNSQKDCSLKGYEIAEFYILPEFRANGYGKQAAEIVIKNFHGHWAISVLPHNLESKKFWKKVINSLTNVAEVEEKVESAKVSFSFVTTPS